MQGKIEFRKALQEIVQTAVKKGNRITQEDAEMYLNISKLSKEQQEMVYQYLSSMNIQVEGIEDSGENPFVQDKGPDVELTEDDRIFLEEYMASAETEQYGQQPEYAKYMKVCAQIALKYAGRDIPLADLIQEANVGLLMAINSLELKDDTITEDEYIREGIRGTIEAFIDEEADLKESDDRMLEKINYIAEAIRNLSEELERKVSLEEVSAYLEMPEEEVAEILKLTGEEIEMQEQSPDKDDDKTVGYADISDFKVF